MNREALNYRDPSTVRKPRMEALNKALGPVGTVYFMRQFVTGSGDYTAERHQWLDGIDEDAFIKEVQELDRARQQKEAAEV
jgi:hypothetical protein